MAKFGCPPRFIAMVRQFHDCMQACVQNDGLNLLSQTGLFSMMFYHAHGCFSGQCHW